MLNHVHGVLGIPPIRSMKQMTMQSQGPPLPLIVRTYTVTRSTNIFDEQTVPQNKNVPDIHQNMGIGHLVHNGNGIGLAKY